MKSWSSTISHKVNLRQKPKHSNKQNQPIPILSSVFTQIPSDSTYIPPPLPPRSQYDNLVLNVKSAIDEGIQPKMISKGSSGSYFARSKNNSTDIEVVAVFKPKDEEVRMSNVIYFEFFFNHFSLALW